MESAASTSSRSNLTQELTRLAAPLVLSNLAYTLLGAIDTFFMGRVSVTAVGAVGIAGMSFVTATLLLRSAVGSCVTFVSRAYGSGDKKTAGSFLGHFMFLALLLSPLALLMPKAFSAYFSAINPNPQVAEAALSFLNIRVFEVPFALANAALGGFLAGIGNTRLSMLFAWIGVTINIIANWILVFGRFGLPALGVSGSALGTVIAVVIQTVVGFIITWRVYKTEFGLTLCRFTGTSMLARMLKIGGPMGLMDFIEIAAWTTFIALISRIGTTELAASQIALQVSGLAFMPGLALGAATCSLVGRFIGAEDIDSAEKTGYRGAVLGMAFMGTLSLVFLLVPGPIARIFTHESGVIAVTTLLLRLLALYQVFDAMNIIFRGALNGAGDTRFTMLLVSLGSWLVLVPGVYLATFTFNMGVAGAWTATILYIVVIGLAVALRFRSGKWKQMTI